MQGIQVARVEEIITRSAYPSRAVLRLGNFHFLLGLCGISCAIASNSMIKIDLDGAKDPFLYGGLAMGVSAVLLGIFTVVSGKSKTGCVLVFLLLFTVIAMFIAGVLAIYSGILFKRLQERKENVGYKVAKFAVDTVLPDNPVSKELDYVFIFCIIFMVLSFKVTLLTLISTCLTCIGICSKCCSSDPPYNRIIYHSPSQPEIISTGNQMSSPPVYEE